MNETVTLYGPDKDNPRGVPKEQQFGFEREKGMHDGRYLTHDDFKRVLAAEGVYIVVKDYKLDFLKDAAKDISPLRELDRKGRLILLTNKPDKNESK